MMDVSEAPLVCTISPGGGGTKTGPDDLLGSWAAGFWWGPWEGALFWRGEYGGAGSLGMVCEWYEGTSETVVAGKQIYKQDICKQFQSWKQGILCALPSCGGPRHCLGIPVERDPVQLTVGRCSRYHGRCLKIFHGDTVVIWLEASWVWIYCRHDACVERESRVRSVILALYRKLGTRAASDDYVAHRVGLRFLLSLYRKYNMVVRSRV